MFILRWGVLCSVVVAMWMPASSQHFAREISQFVGENARPFLQPLADAVSSNVHAGLFAPAFGSDGLHVSVQIVGMAVGIPDELKTFKAAPFSRPVEFTQGGIVFIGDLQIPAATLPTAAGLSRTSTFTGRLTRVRPKGLPYTPGVYDFIQRDATVTVGGGEDFSTVIIGTPQLAVGSLYGTDLLVRYVPPVSLPELGEAKAFGIGVRHTVDRYVSLPFELGAVFMYQSLTLKANEQEYSVEADLSAYTLQIMLSKRIGMGLIGFTPYAAAGYESGTLNVGYVFADPYIGKQQLEFDGGGRARLLVGIGFSISRITLQADYNIALLNGLSFGIGVAF
ncbi:MAG TPA: DUF6588 family protein [Bacteroidota bacterium]|nr:DUF6588 family protein [Bacteroidota bacterium]